MITTSPDGSTYPAQRTLEDGDELNGDNFLAVFSDSAQRAEFLKLALEAVQVGVKAIRFVQSVADLKDRPGAAPGQVVMLIDGTRAPRLFMFQNGALAADVPGLAYNSTVSAGFWGSELYRFTTGSGVGLRFDTQTLPVSRTILAAPEVIDVAPSTRTLADGSGWRDVGIPHLTRTLAVGDIVDVHADLIWSVSAAEDPQFRLYVSAPSGAAALDGSEILVQPFGANKKTPLHLAGRWTATEVGSHVFSIQGKTDAGGLFDISFHAPRALRALVIGA